MNGSTKCSLPKGRKVPRLRIATDHLTAAARPVHADSARRFAGFPFFEQKGSKDGVPSVGLGGDARIGANRLPSAPIASRLGVSGSVGHT